jgi:hypothetical protein
VIEDHHQRHDTRHHGAGDRVAEPSKPGPDDQLRKIDQRDRQVCEDGEEAEELHQRFRQAHAIGHVGRDGDRELQPQRHDAEQQSRPCQRWFEHALFVTPPA